MMATVSRYIHAVFCDDVRVEVGDKLTFVGTYQGTMNIQTEEMPVVVPKLCIAASAHAPVDDLFERLRFRVMRDEVLLFESEVPRDQLTEPLKDKNSKYRTIGAIFTISPFIINENCTLRVHADTERGEVVSLGLKVKVTLNS